MSFLDTIRAQPPKKLALIGGGAAVALAAVVGGAIVLTGGDDEETPVATSTTTTTEAEREPEAEEVVAPLTGLPGDFEGRIERSALVVKIDNVEPLARRQVGLNQADVVYEERVEGSVTRLLAIFHSQDVEGVGPIRSARSSDIPILASLNKPYFAWSGANPTFAQAIREEANVVDVGVEAFPGLYFRDTGRSAPSNLMATSTDELLEQTSEGSQPPTPLFEYRDGDEEVANLEDVTHVRVTFGTSAGAAPVEYQWDGEGWARSQAGTPHVDSEDVQVAPANVIIQFTPYISSGVNDQFGNPIREADLLGEGDAWVLTDGGLVRGRWKKDAMDAITAYADTDGNPIALTPGRTWVELPEPGGAEEL
jgi:hypothetical protein